MQNFHSSQSYNRRGIKPLPPTFDVDFINHIGSYTDHLLETQEQDWVHIEKMVHIDFDAKFGADFVARHIAKFKSG